MGAGFTPEELCRQLNEWRASVDGERTAVRNQHVETQKNLAMANGSLMMMGAKVDAIEGKVQESMQRMTEGGLAALRTVIEEFQVKINQHE